MPYRQNTDQPMYPHLGEPEGLTTRAALDWKRVNTYYIRRNEHLDSEVLAEPMACFTPEEWVAWLTMLMASGGYHLPNSPRVTSDEGKVDRLDRHRRAARMAACDDCTLAQQLSERLAGRCHPLRYAITPVKRLMESEGVPDGATARDGTEPAHVLFQEIVPE